MLGVEDLQAGYQRVSSAGSRRSAWRECPTWQIAPDGRLDILKIRPLARLGYHDYTTVDSLFELVIPGDNENLLKGLEGAAGGKKGF